MTKYPIYLSIGKYICKVAPMVCKVYTFKFVNWFNSKIYRIVSESDWIFGRPSCFNIVQHCMAGALGDTLPVGNVGKMGKPWSARTARLGTLQ